MGALAAPRRVVQPTTQAGLADGACLVGEDRDNGAELECILHQPNAGRPDRIELRTGESLARNLGVNARHEEDLAARRARAGGERGEGRDG